MKCVKCHREILEGSHFCNFCGKKQVANKRKTIKRENGSGTVYKRSDYKNNPWIAAAPGKPVFDEVTLSLKYQQMIIGRYATAIEAKAALEQYLIHPTDKYNLTLEDVHTEWQLMAYRKISKQTKDNYNAAWYKLRSLYAQKFRQLRTGDMQAVIDYYDTDHQKEGKDGKLLFDHDHKPIMTGPLSFSSLSKVKALLTSMYDYAMQNDIVMKNYASYIILPPPGESQKDRFNDMELQKIKLSIGKVKLADCIYMMCYTGHRVAEFLQLTPDKVLYLGDTLYLVGGNKTSAGEQKVVPICSEIQPLFESWLARKGQTIICREDGSPWTVDNFREHFKAALKEIGVRVLTPHATRRTFATNLSAAGVQKQDIIALMGHTNFDVDLKHYINQQAKTLKNAVERLSSIA